MMYREKTAVWWKKKHRLQKSQMSAIIESVCTFFSQIGERGWRSDDIALASIQCVSGSI